MFHVYHIQKGGRTVEEITLGERTRNGKVLSCLLDHFNQRLARFFNHYLEGVVVGLHLNRSRTLSEEHREINMHILAQCPAHGGVRDIK